MIIDLTRLNSGIDKVIMIDEVYSFDKEYIKNSEILELNNISIKGEIKKDSLNNIVINLSISGIMVLACAITLKPVDYEFETQISGNLEEMWQEINEFDKNLENTIDILPIIWENILMEIPMKVVSEEAKSIHLEGNGWKFITEEDKENINPAFEKLNDLLNEK